MDPVTTAIPQLSHLSQPPVLAWNQLETSTESPEVGYSSFEQGLLQRVRDLHVKVENHLKALPVNEESIAEAVGELVEIDCPLPAKFTKVNVAELIKKNKNIQGAESLLILVAALGLLEKYGRNLLKPQRPPMWKFINFANSVFRMRVDIIKGARGILQLMGYSNMVEDGLCFPSDAVSPDMNMVAVVTSDLVIAKQEIDLYNKGEHPHEYRIKDCLEGTMIQVTADSPSGGSQNIFMRQSGSTRKTLYENFDVVFPHSKIDHKGVHNTPRAVSPSSRDTSRVILPNISLPVISDMSLVSGTEGIVCRIGDPQSSSMQKTSAVGLEYLADPSGLSVKPSTQVDVKLDNSSTQKTEDRSEILQSNECVMCGKPTAKVQCSTCSGLRCEVCDNRWHLHPSRRSHNRHVVESSPFIDTILCDICGTKPASLFCASCSTESGGGNYCSDCDRVYHGHPQRQTHSRQPLESRQSDPAVNLSLNNIVLSPVTSASSTKGSSVPSGASSLPNRKPPVPAPRRSKRDSTDKEQLKEVIVDEQESQDVFMPEEAKDAESKLKAPSQQSCKRVKSESTFEAFQDDATSTKSFHSLQKTRADVESQVEEIMQKDITILQEIQTKRDALGKCPNDSDEYRSIQTDIGTLLNKHQELMKKQTELEQMLEKMEELKPSDAEPQQFGDSSTARKVTAGDATGVSAATVIKDRPPPTPQHNINIPVTHGHPASKPPIAAKPISSTSPHLAPVTAPSKPEVSSKPSVNRSQSSSSTTSVATPSGPGNRAWVCIQCRNVNITSSASPVCMTCQSPRPVTTPSVPALSQQHGATVRRHVPPPSSPKPVPNSQPTAPTSPLSPKAASSVTKNPTKQPDTVSIFAYLQMEEEAMLQVKLKAKEEYERQMAMQQEDKETTPTPMPRVKKEAKKCSFKGVQSPSTTVSNQPKLNQGGILEAKLKGASTSPPPAATPALHHHMLIEERKRLDKLRAESLDLIQKLKEAEGKDYLPEEVVVASKKIKENGSETMDEVQWLEANWNDYVFTVTAEATNILKKEVGQSQGMVRKDDAVRALRKHCGDAAKAVEECVSHTQDMVLSLVDMGFPHKRVCELLSTRSGSIEGIVLTLQQEMVTEFVDHVWTKEDDKGQQRLLVDLGVDRHPDTINRRLRMLLVEYELPSWGRAITATKLIDTNKYIFMDAITAARECGDMERAKQYLEKECEVCWGEFSMNKLSTLSHCQCKICQECLHGYFKEVINGRNILNASCPMCDQPDLRSNDLNTTEDYFQYLDMLLKGILDPDSYQLFQNKLRDWNLMKEKNFRWCAHCGNGFINEAPDRRKMKCNECRQITCFLCKKPWMAQHEKTTCEEFQAWKEANDPNRQADALAIHLKENGIDCPHCNMRYELAKGGCMHFKCVQCTHEFCSGCSSPFKKAIDCNRFASCQSRGLHSHHPRDCLFYLRDKKVDELKKLLQKYNVGYKQDNPANQQLVCSVMEQKESPDGLKDDQCGRKVLCAGLCDIHYKEYLVSMINKNHIDPAEEYSSEELALILQRCELEIPARNRDSEKDYRTRLLQEVKRKLPLEKKNPRDREQLM